MSGARVGLRIRLRTDWFRVLTQLQYAQPAAFPNQRVAELLGVPLSTLRGWKNGSEPAYIDGSNLLELWSEVTGCAVRDRPMELR